MSERDILNERVSWDETVQDSMCPDFGFGNKLPNTRAYVKAPGGQPVSRETSNSGRTLSLSWLNRSYLCVQRLKHFYEQYEDGYFTLIDHDGGGRHYVGRFTGEFNPVQKGNDRYDVSDLTFEEIPGTPMVQYPSDWTKDSIALPAFNDFGQLLAATHGDWQTGNIPGFRTLGTAIVGNYLAMEYRGYGFELWMQRGPDGGIVQVLLDGVVQGPIDLYAPQPTFAQMVLRKAAVPLNLHRVKLLMTGTRNPASSGNSMGFCKLQVMR